MNSSAPTRPALRYFGGKWRIAPWIIDFFPPHVCYVEPFAGAASLLLRKRPSRYEYYNDANGEIVNFFKVLRDDGKSLIRAIELTPYSREELRTSLQPCSEPLERARRLYVRFLQGRGGHEATTGWRYQRSRARSKSALDDFANTSHLQTIIQRLKEVAIENDDAMAVLRRFDASETLFYVDPPYLSTTRSKTSGRYATEFKTDREHRILAAILAELEGMVVLSGFASELYEELFEGKCWKRFDKKALTQAGESTESVWLNPACQRAQRQLELVG